MNTLTPQINKQYSYNQIRKIIGNLVNEECEDNNKSTCQLNHLQNLLLISIADNPEKDVSKVE